MIYTLFFSRLRDAGPQLRGEYEQRSAELKDRAVREHPGFVGIKNYVAEDGERLSVVRFKDEESQRSWKLDPIHKVAQDKGRTDYYERYRIAVLKVLKTYDWERHPAGASVQDSETDTSKEDAA